MAENKIKTQVGDEALEIPVELLQKYDRQIPRYTSYPTAPAWHDLPAENFSAGLKSLPQGADVSLYFHVPFCEERCRFCGCSTIATRKKSAAVPYIEALKKELSLVSSAARGVTVSSVHFGGGTPTFIGAAGLGEILNAVGANFKTAFKEVSIEVDPRRVEPTDISQLAKTGFSRISLGVQDLNPEVCSSIGRVCSSEKIGEIISAARNFGFRGVNCDVVYGLPCQTPDSFLKTLEGILKFSPDRIACFNFAFLPKILPHQLQIDCNAMPVASEKFKLFAMAVEFFTQHGFEWIGLDHFAKANNSLGRAVKNGSLTRNFQGYVPDGSTSLVGVGMTSISEAAGFFAQNSKKLSDYYRRIDSGSLATVRGVKLSNDDAARQKIIRDIMCLGRCSFENVTPPDISELVSDGIVVRTDNGLKLTTLGRFFSRNVAACFDAYLNCGASFSRAV